MVRKCFGNRCMALFVMLAMVMSLFTPVAWADTSGILYGEINVSGINDGDSIPTQEEHTVFVTAEYSNSNDGTSDIRVYLGSDISDITLTQFDKTAEGGKYGPYIICYDNTLNQYYISVGDENINAGSSTAFPLTFKFNSTTIDGSKVTFALYNGTTQATCGEGNTDVVDFTVYAQAEAQWSVLKTANPSYLTLNTNATTLADNTSSAGSISYTINEGERNETNSTTLDTGEAAIYSYTSYDTVTLPAGTYIAAATEADVADAIKAAYSIQNVNYEIKSYTYADGKITGFTVYWTETNSGAASGEGMTAKSYTATLDASKILVSDIASYSADSLKNDIETEYITKTTDENGNVVDKTNTTSSPTATTNIAKDGEALGGVTKTVDWVNSTTASMDWTGWVNGYVTSGDTIKFKLTITNNSTTQQTYTVTDILSDSNLTFKEFNGCWNGTYSDFDASAQSFTATVNANSTLELWFTATVNEDKATTITNTATVTINGKSQSADTQDQPIEQKETTPDISISKEVDGLDGTVYKLGDEFYYVITVKNTGKAVAEKISISDFLPSEVEYISHEVTNAEATATSSSSVSDLSETEEDDTTEPTAEPTTEPKPDYISGTVTNLGAGESAVIKVKVKVKSDSIASSITNTASAVLEDTNTEKESSKTITQNTATVNRLTISKTTTAAIVNPGDTVTYTITVANPWGNGKLDNVSFSVVDVIPDGLTYVSTNAAEVGGNVTQGDNGNVTVNFSNVTLQNGGNITFTITCQVHEGATADSNYNNTVTIYDENGTAGGYATNTDITPSGTSSDSTIQVEKKMYVNGNEVTDGKIFAGDTVEFRVTVTNKGQNNITNFSVNDILEGNYVRGHNGIEIKVSQFDCSQGATVLGSTLELFKGDKIFTNGNFTMHFDNNSGVNYAYDVAYQSDSGLVIPPNGYITLSYSVTTAADFTVGSNTVIATNKADGKTSTDSVEYEAVAPTPSPTPEPGEVTPEPVVNSSLEITKEVTNPSVGAYTVGATATDSAKTEIEKYRFGYTVTVKNTSEYDYTTTGAVFEDRIPEGFALSIDKDATYAQYNWVLSNPYMLMHITGKNVDQYGNEGTQYFGTSDAVQSGNGVVTIKVDDNEYSINPWLTLQEVNKDNTSAWDTWTEWDGTQKYSFNANKANYKIEGTILTVSFADSITIPAGQSLTFTYYLTPTTAEAEAIYAEMTANNSVSFKDRAYKNEATFSGDAPFKNNGVVVSSISDAETVRIYSPEIHPGIDKQAMYAVSNGDSDIEDTKVDEVKVTRGDVFIWKVAVYNEKDLAGGGKAMTDYTVTDVIPEYYEYAGQSFENAGDSTGSKISYTAKVYIDGTELDIYPEYNNGVFDFSDSRYTLYPGHKLEFYIITQPIGGIGTQTPYGLYTNEVTLKTKQTFKKENVSAGTLLPDGTIYASATIPLYLVSTSSVKSITNDEGKTASSNDAAVVRNVKADMGDTVTYTLSVTNHDDTDNYMEDFAIIDRLPYTTDEAENSVDYGILTDENRGSKFPVRYSSLESAVITYNGIEYDVKDCISEAYASNPTAVFEPTDMDWLGVDGAKTRVIWGNENVASTNLVRFCLLESKLASKSEVFKYGDTVGIPPKATITIKYKAEVPSYVQNSGEGNFAWNSFAYYFNCKLTENMVAEPGKVGLWVDDTTTGGSILLRKRYTSNMPNEYVTFYFALFDKPYDPETNATPIQKAYIKMKGTEAGSVATTYFTNIEVDEYTNYYIYETDSYGKPLVADEVTTETQTYYEKDENGNDITSNPISKEVITSKTVKQNGYNFTMDNQPQVNQAMKKPNEEQFNGEYLCYNNKYLVWHKALSPTSLTNSAIFTNTYKAGVDHIIMGPFYADVPTSQSEGATNKMTSTRPEEFTSGEITTVVESDKREIGYAADSTYSMTNAGTAYGEDQKHTIATGFLAELTSKGNYTLEQVKWTVTTSDPKTNTNPGIYVRLRTETAYSSQTNEAATIMYLSDFDVYEEESDEHIELGMVGGFDGIEDDESFISDYTVEERAAMIAEGLGVDPDNILYDDYGQPYVIMDEGLEEEAFSISEAETASYITSAVNFSGVITEATEFSDYNTTKGYAIYKLNSNASRYTMRFNDNLPHITLTPGAKAYVGIIIDQLYDQKATADIELSDVPSFDETMIVAASKASDQQYTLVKSPYQKGGFALGMLMKLTSGTTYTFDNFVAETSKITGSIVNANNTFEINATSAKAVTLNVGEYSAADVNCTSYLALNGSGNKNYRSVLVNAAADQTLSFVARSTSNESRTLIVEYTNADGKTVKKSVSVPGSNADSYNAGSVTIDTGGAVYIYSSNSGIDIFSITAG